MSLTIKKKMIRTPFDNTENTCNNYHPMWGAELFYGHLLSGSIANIALRILNLIPACSGFKTGGKSWQPK
jgi:hypothetical protein